MYKLGLKRVRQTNGQSRRQKLGIHSIYVSILYDKTFKISI